MRFAASEFYEYQRPSRCGLRVRLRAIGEPEDPPGDYQDLLLELGERHERRHLASLGEYVDLDAGTEDERVRRTQDHVREGAPVLYQPFLRSTLATELGECEIVGAPDFLIKRDDGYVIRDSKLSRKITERDHPEVLRQVQLYGWLFERMFGQPPAELEVHSGTGEIVGVPYDEGERAQRAMLEILRYRRGDLGSYTPVGWTKCGSCGFRSRCWPRAEAARDVALVMGVDQSLAIALREQGTETIEQLVANFDEASLSALQKRRGKRFVKVGKDAAKILMSAQALDRGEEITLAPPQLPEHDNYVMFDLEGVPPELGEREKIYLWGLQVFGADQGEFRAALAGFGEDGDRDGWFAFLREADGLFERHGDLLFVHWYQYERDRLDQYIERFGDPDGIAGRVRGNLLDLLPITRDSVVLPIQSYSLKVVEDYVGFKRTLPDVNGEWAIAQYIKATETTSNPDRDALIDEILAYNREDLEAMWAVLQWLQTRTDT